LTGTTSLQKRWFHTYIIWGLEWCTAIVYTHGDWLLCFEGR
jgi:hypothetical protein